MDLLKRILQIGLVMGAAAACAAAQESALPSAPSAVRVFAGWVVARRAAVDVVRLTLDDAVQLALKNNFQIALAQQQANAVQGQRLTAFQSLMPELSLSAKTDAKEINLAAMGFKPSTLPVVPGQPAIKSIVKVKTTSAQINVSQMLFNLPAYEVYRGAKAAVESAALGALSSHGGVVQAVGTQYLQTLAAASDVANARALLTSDAEVLRQATESHDAGVGTNLDVLRARVAYQTQQQALVAAENVYAKSMMQLNRLIGQPVEQKIELVDTVPFAELAVLPLAEAKTIAYARRKDLLTLQAEARAAEFERRAIKFERLPTMRVHGFYGVLGETTGLYHGVFTAQAGLQFPIFQEAQIRGDREVSDALLGQLRAQIEDLKIEIDAQIRTSMLDVSAAAARVKVARSNVALASELLEDSVQRFKAGVDDALPVVQAQAEVAAAQTQEVRAEFEYNAAKLGLARNTGVIETQYGSYLGR